VDFLIVINFHVKFCLKNVTLELYQWVIGGLLVGYSWFIAGFALAILATPGDFSINYPTVAPGNTWQFGKGREKKWKTYLKKHRKCPNYRKYMSRKK
jgi:hypothetical protein